MKPPPPIFIFMNACRKYEFWIYDCCKRYFGAQKHCHKRGGASQKTFLDWTEHCSANKLAASVIWSAKPPRTGQRSLESGCQRAGQNSLSVAPCCGGSNPEPPLPATKARRSTRGSACFSLAASAPQWRIAGARRPIGARRSPVHAAAPVWYKTDYPLRIKSNPVPFVPRHGLRPSKDSCLK